MNRLLPAPEVNDGEPSHRKADRVVSVKAVFVRPAMTNRLAHPREQRFIRALIFLTDNADDATHLQIPF
jgi:hypothetical protein